MALEIRRHRFTRAEFERMGDLGILKPGVRVELLDGEVIEMSPAGSRHRACVDRLADLFVPSARVAAIVRIQSLVALAEHEQPEPDLALLRRRTDFYADGGETAADVLLIVEVADTSEAYDRLVKVPLYARHGIPEVWIADLNREQIVVYRDPGPDGSASRRVYRRGESISPLAFPDLTIPVEAILG